MPDARTVLEDPDLDGLLSSLGLRPQDAAELGAVVARVRHDPAALAAVDGLAAELRGRLGRFPGEPGPDTWAGYDPAEDADGAGVRPLLALVVTASELVALHRARGVPADVSAATLRELGQQVWVHRLTFGSLGLHTYGWLLVTWSGSLYWLGRLQFNLELLDGRWVCSTHIPRSGPLAPAAVDASFAAAAAFFPTHFPDRPVQDFWCSSWLLDPTLVQALDQTSNMARFQARWRLYGDPMPGDEDALFFTFARRGAVDLATLPRDTTLQRVVAERLESGGHWAVRTGRLPLTTIGVPA